MQSTETKICTFCGATYARNPRWSRAHFAKRKACSSTCRSAHAPNILDDYQIDENGCWNWLGRIDSNGYGKAYDPSRPAGHRVDWAHRVSYRIHCGAIPEGSELDHECENTRCVNPDHLAPVTRAEHVRRTAERAGHLERRAQAAALRAAGLTYNEIAEALGLNGRTAAHSRVKKAINSGMVDPNVLPKATHLNDVERDDVRYLVELGIPQTEVAAWYGVDGSHISRICSGTDSREAGRRQA